MEGQRGNGGAVTSGRAKKEKKTPNKSRLPKEMDLTTKRHSKVASEWMELVLKRNSKKKGKYF